MSATNPEKAMRALLPEPVATACGVVVAPLALGRYALLERLKSPMLSGAEADTLALLPTLWALCAEPAAVLAALADPLPPAVAWADTLPPDAIGEIARAAREQVARMLDVIGQEQAKKKGAATTAGSPPSPSGPAKPTAGGLTKSSGACPPAPSC